ncbi:DNA methyltransferase [Hymenobacter yonginensis]|uniref:site-specific DNA-methyltransferase (cytosine-N(4)-specific) n=1 Tax=Hymenobacter yonginensis TaxID=748197 RepID=A0ABY7PU38_9BACT|nr:DNA methyltransferase [Hymenobacter yonginensis]WBO86409.1 DNA methyltransferase [Hymenobacter yonginensis]
MPSKIAPVNLSASSSAFDLFSSVIEASSNTTALANEDHNLGFNIEHDSSFAALVNFSKEELPFHQWFKYREGFSPELVNRFMASLSPGSVVLDPFVGCGTTTTTAKLAGHKSIGFDVNPISVLVSQVKGRAYNAKDIKKLKDLVKKVASISEFDEAAPVPKLKIIGKVYPVDVLTLLLQLKKKISSIEEDKYRDFVFVAWLSILEVCSATFKEGNGIKYRNAKRSKGKYITNDFSEWANKYYGDDQHAFVINKLVDKLNVMLNDVEHNNSGKYDAVIIEDTSLSIKDKIGSNSVDLAIYSPPYINCFNYFKIYKVELWMGGWIEDYGVLKYDNDKSLRSHVETKLKRAYDDDVSILDPYLAKINVDNLWDKRIIDAIKGYFIDMREVLRGLIYSLKPNGKSVCVVGNSCYDNVVIPTDVILSKIGEELGFKVDRIIETRKLPVVAQQAATLGQDRELVRESILVFTKPDTNWHFSLPGTKRELTKVDSLPEASKIDSETTYLISNTGLRSGTHLFHKYAGKFIPHIPKWAIENYSKKGDTVFEPFLGSGTTLVEGSLLGRKCFGGDIDPLSCMIAKSKCLKISDTVVNAVMQEWVIFAAENDWTIRREEFVPKIKNINVWFTESAIDQLSSIKYFIEKSRGYEVNLFLKVVMSSILRKASNADDQSLKTYISHTKEKIPQSAIDLFANNLGDYALRLKQYNAMLPEPVHIIDEFDASKEIGWVNNIDLIVTSPPYLKSIDYLYNQLVEYFWLGEIFGLELPSMQNEHKKKYIGTEKGLKNVVANVSDKAWSSVLTNFDQDSKEAKVIHNYFSMMECHLRIAYDKLKHCGHYVLVIGASTVRGIVVDTPEILLEIMKSIGFKSECNWKYEIRNRHMRFPRKGNGGIIHDDYVIVVKK